MQVNIRYGKKHSQYGELYVPVTNCIGTVCLLHGGFWTMPHGLNQFDAVATELLTLGYGVWNIEYTRIGEIAHQWEDTFNDTVNAVNQLVKIKNTYSNINLDNVLVIGHSAGGQLAIWLNSQDLKINVSKFIGLSPILDLEAAYYTNAGNGCVEKLLHGNPNEFPERYSYSSPICQSKKNSSELIIHGTKDEYVPVEWSKSYHKKMQQFTNVSEFIELKNCGHMDFIDTKSNAFNLVKLNL